MKKNLKTRIKAIEKDLAELKKEFQPKIEVGSWWLGSQTKEKAKVTEVINDKVHIKYEDGYSCYWTKEKFIPLFTPCEAPKKETWYLCAEDYESGSGGCFKRGQEYKQADISGLSIQFEINGGLKFINRPTERGIMVSPQER